METFSLTHTSSSLLPFPSPLIHFFIFCVSLTGTSLSFPILLFLRKMGGFKTTSECSVRLGSGENTCPNSEKLTLRKLLSSTT